MSGSLRRWWPALPAAIILYLGAADFLARYPRAQERRSERLAGSGPDTLLAFARAFAADTGRRGNAAAESPFRPLHPPRPQGAAAAAGMRIEPPPRRYILKGTVGREVATIANNAGNRQIVRVGDSIDSAEVVSIESNRVVLRDRAGKFELQTEK